MATTKLAPRQAKSPTEWQFVGKQVEVLRRDVRNHFDRIGSDAAAQRTAIEDALRNLSKDVEKVFTAAGQTLRDPALRKDVSAIAEAIRKALQDTVDHVAAANKKAAKPALKSAATRRTAAKTTTTKVVAAKRPASRRP